MRMMVWVGLLIQLMGARKLVGVDVIVMVVFLTTFNPSCPSNHVSRYAGHRALPLRLHPLLPTPTSVLNCPAGEAVVLCVAAGTSVPKSPVNNNCVKTVCEY